MDQLVALFYPELRRLAAARMRGERSTHSWQPTVLVNEFYLELLKCKALKTGRDEKEHKQAFLDLAGFMMKRLLIHHARPLASRAVKVPVDESGQLCEVQDLQLVEDILSRLEQIDPALRSVVEMKVFDEMPVDEIARQLACAPRTVARRWAFARRWLKAQLSGEQL